MEDPNQDLAFELPWVCFWRVHGRVGNQRVSVEGPNRDLPDGEPWARSCRGHGRVGNQRVSVEGQIRDWAYVPLEA